jgi:hypothetical protein
MGSLSVNPKEAEWLEAVYTLTSTPLPAVSNGAAKGDADRLKKKLATRRQELEKRLKAIKGGFPAALNAKLLMVGNDLEANYKVEALEGRLKEIEEQIAAVEQSGGFKGDSKEWANEIRRMVPEFEKSCKEAEVALVKLAQDRAAALAKTETDPFRKKRLAAAAGDASVHFIAVPITRVSERFAQDLELGGEKKKSATLAKYRQELKTTSADIEKVIAGQRFVAVVRREQKPKEQQRDSDLKEKAAKAVADKIKILRELDAARAKGFDDQLKAADSGKKVSKIEAAVDIAIASAQLSPRQVTATQEALGAKAAIATKAKSGKKGDQKAKLQDLENGLNGTKALAATGNRKVVEAAEKLAEEMAAAATNPKVAKLFTDVEALKKDLTNTDLIRFYPKEQPVLQQNLKKLGAEVDPLDLEPSETALATYTARINKLTADTATRRQWQKDMKGKLGSLRARIANILGDALFITGKDAKRGMVQKMKELQNAAAQPESKMPDVDQEFAVLKAQVDRLFALKHQSGKNAAEKAEFDTLMKADRAAGDQLEAERKDVSKKLTQLRTRRQRVERSVRRMKPAAKGDPAMEDDLALVEELLKSALQLAKARQLDDATKKVDNAEGKMERLFAAIPANADDAIEFLRDQAAGGWANAVGNITKKIAEIKTAALELAKTEKFDGGKVSAPMPSRPISKLRSRN